MVEENKTQRVVCPRYKGDTMQKLPNGSKSSMLQLQKLFSQIDGIPVCIMAARSCSHTCILVKNCNFWRFCLLVSGIYKNVVMVTLLMT